MYSGRYRYRNICFSRAFPHTHRQAPGKEHVHELLHFVAELESEPLAHHHVPAGPELLVEDLFNRFRTLALLN